jgi:hypothetical protein
MTDAGSLSGEDRAEIDYVVSTVLRAKPASSWQVKRLRRLLAAGREQALNRAYVLGIFGGALALQQDLEAHPDNLEQYAATIAAGQHAMLPLPNVASAMDSGDFADGAEWMAAIDRYTTGWVLAVETLLVARARGPEAADRAIRNSVATLDRLNSRSARL